MSQERRQHTRLEYPLEANWRGASGGSRCRISDISVTGCFIQTLGAPKVGESTNLTIDFPDGPLDVKGRVTYTETGMGFGVEFLDVEDGTKAAIAGALETLASRPKDS